MNILAVVKLWLGGECQIILPEDKRYGYKRKEYLSKLSKIEESGMVHSQPNALLYFHPENLTVSIREIESIRIDNGVQSVLKITCKID